VLGRRVTDACTEHVLSNRPDPFETATSLRPVGRPERACLANAGEARDDPDSPFSTQRRLVEAYLSEYERRTPHTRLEPGLRRFGVSPTTRG